MYIKTRGVTFALWPCHFTLKKYLKAKRRKPNMETQIFHHAKIQSSKNPLKETKNPSRYYYY
jgi:hypothetical protein